MKKLVLISLLFVACTKDKVEPIAPPVISTDCQCDESTFWRAIGATDWNYIQTSQPDTMDCNSAGDFYNEDSTFLRIVSCW